MIAILTHTERPSKYWSDLKVRLIEEGYIEVSARVGQFKLRAPDGKMRETDCADMETMLRIIQSIRSPKAEPFKQWLAGLGAEVIEVRNEDSEANEDRRRLEYREQSKEMHKGLHAEIHQRGVRRPREHAEFDVRGHKILYDGETPRETEAKRGIPPGEGPRWMGSEEMADNIFRDAQSRAYIKRLDIQGKEPVMEAHEAVSQEVRDTIIRLGNTPPEDLPKARKSIEQVAKADERRRTQGMDLWPELDAPADPPPANRPKHSDDAPDGDGQE